MIGNGAYSNAPALPNPTNDAGDIATSLKRLGFSVRKSVDAKFDAMRRALIEFGREARDSEVAMVFFAGHGMEVGGENWLIPVDAELLNDTDAENEAINLKAVTLQVAKASQLGLVMLDACRNNPFSAKMTRSPRTRAVPRGLARDWSRPTTCWWPMRRGTAPRQTTVPAAIRPFTTALLNNLEKPARSQLHVPPCPRRGDGGDAARAAALRLRLAVEGGDLSEAARRRRARLRRRPLRLQRRRRRSSLQPCRRPPRAVNAFDGTWMTTQKCPDVGKVKGYDWNYKVVVKDGQLQGGYNAKTGGDARSQRQDQSGRLRLSRGGRHGRVLGLCGRRQEIGLGGEVFCRGKFGGTRGTGSRLTTRKCDFTFVKLD